MLRDFFDAKQIDQLKARAAELLEAFNPQDHPLTRFVSDTDDHVGDEYFLNSGDKVRFFMEPDAVDSVTRQLSVPKQRAVNKIGHALHELDPTFKEFSFQPKIREIAQQLKFQDPRVLQSMLIFKQPKIGGKVPPHQDSTFLYTKPLSAVGFWFALEDCTMNNGCLSFIPGSHENIPVTSRFVRRSEEIGTMFIGKDNMKELADDPNFVAETCPAGTLVLIHGSVVHRSEANFSEHSRWAYTFHVIDGSSYYPSNNWLQPTEEMPFTPLLSSQ